jgi:hypothetical protein
MMVLTDRAVLRVRRSCEKKLGSFFYSGCTIDARLQFWRFSCGDKHLIEYRIKYDRAYNGTDNSADSRAHDTAHRAADSGCERRAGGNAYRRLYARNRSGG